MTSAQAQFGRSKSSKGWDLQPHGEEALANVSRFLQEQAHQRLETPVVPAVQMHSSLPVWAIRVIRALLSLWQLQHRIECLKQHIYDVMIWIRSLLLASKHVNARITEGCMVKSGRKRRERESIGYVVVEAAREVHFRSEYSLKDLRHVEKCGMVNNSLVELVLNALHEEQPRNITSEKHKLASNTACASSFARWNATHKGFSHKKRGMCLTSIGNGSKGKPKTAENRAAIEDEHCILEEASTLLPRKKNSGLAHPDPFKKFTVHLKVGQCTGSDLGGGQLTLASIGQGNTMSHRRQATPFPKAKSGIRNNDTEAGFLKKGKSTARESTNERVTRQTPTLPLAAGLMKNKEPKNGKSQSQIITSNGRTSPRFRPQLLIDDLKVGKCLSIWSLAEDLSSCQSAIKDSTISCRANPIVRKDTSSTMYQHRLLEDLSGDKQNETARFIAKKVHKMPGPFNSRVRAITRKYHEEIVDHHRLTEIPDVVPRMTKRWLFKKAQLQTKGDQRKYSTRKVGTMENITLEKPKCSKGTNVKNAEIGNKPKKNIGLHTGILTAQNQLHSMTPTHVRIAGTTGCKHESEIKRACQKIQINNIVLDIRSPGMIHKDGCDFAWYLSDNIDCKKSKENLVGTTLDQENECQHEIPKDVCNLNIPVAATKEKRQRNVNDKQQRFLKKFLLREACIKKECLRERIPIKDIVFLIRSSGLIKKCYAREKDGAHATSCIEEDTTEDLVEDVSSEDTSVMSTGVEEDVFPTDSPGNTRSEDTSLSSTGDRKILDQEKFVLSFTFREAQKRRRECLRERIAVKDIAFVVRSSGLMRKSKPVNQGLSSQDYYNSFNIKQYGSKVNTEDASSISRMSNELDNHIASSLQPSKNETTKKIQGNDVSKALRIASSREESMKRSCLRKRIPIKDIMFVVRSSGLIHKGEYDEIFNKDCNTENALVRDDTSDLEIVNLGSEMEKKKRDAKTATSNTVSCQVIDLLHKQQDSEDFEKNPAFCWQVAKDYTLPGGNEIKHSCISWISRSSDVSLNSAEKLKGLTLEQKQNRLDKHKTEYRVESIDQMKNQKIDPLDKNHCGKNPSEFFKTIDEAFSKIALKDQFHDILYPLKSRPFYYDKEREEIVKILKIRIDGLWTYRTEVRKKNTSGLMYNVPAEFWTNTLEMIKGNGSHGFYATAEMPSDKQTAKRKSPLVAFNTLGLGKQCVLETREDKDVKEEVSLADDEKAYKNFVQGYENVETSADSEKICECKSREAQNTTEERLSTVMNKKADKSDADDDNIPSFKQLYVRSLRECRNQTHGNHEGRGQTLVEMRFMVISAWRRFHSE